MSGLFMDDITYCGSVECERTDCARHMLNKPDEVRVFSCADFLAEQVEGEECRYYFSYLE